MSARSVERAERNLGLWLCAPALLVMALVTLYPIAHAFVLSLMRYDLRFPEDSGFVGLSNYVSVLSSPFWWQAFWNTLFISVVSVSLELVLGMALALLMHHTRVLRGAVRTAILVPYGLVTVVSAYSFRYAWTPGIGYLAALLPDGSAPLTSHAAAQAIIIAAEVWKTTPFMALLLLSGLSQVPATLLQAARIDGANALQRFVWITLPLMRPTILVALLFRTLDAFRIFDHIFVLTGGARNTGSVSILGYHNLFSALNLGIGSAISVLIFFTVALIAWLFVRVLGAGFTAEERG